MIEIVDTGSKYLTVVSCDTCHRPIKSELRGIVAWENESGSPRFYHKGACDPHSETLSLELGMFLDMVARTYGARGRS